MLLKSKKKKYIKTKMFSNIKTPSLYQPKKCYHYVNSYSNKIPKQNLNIYYNYYCSTNNFAYQ